jgi:hypothetical protein
MLRRLKAQTVPDNALHERAVAGLTRRLDQWWGGSLAPLSRFSDAPPARMPATLTADRVELLIVRAISAISARGPATFGVTSGGAVFTTDTGSWSDDAHAVFVTGLSTLLDEAADIFQHHTGGRGGRFIELDGRFYTAILGDDTKGEHIRTAAIITSLPPAGSPFALVQSGETGLWQRVRSFFRNWRDTAHADEPVQEAPWSDPGTAREPAAQLVIRFGGGVPWPVSGVLSEMGYHVGKNGLAPAERREILQRVFVVELVATSPETDDYIREWGAPGSTARCSKMANCLKGFIEINRRKTTADMSAAIADWESDLQWLTTIFGC